MNSLPSCSASCLRQLRLADAGRAGEEEAAGRPVGLAETGPRALDRLRDERARLLPGRTPRARGPPRGVRSRSWSDDGRLLRRNARHARDDLDVGASTLRPSALGPDRRRGGPWALGPGPGRCGRPEPGPRARHPRPAERGRRRPRPSVDGAVGQPVVAQVPRGEPGRRLERLVRVVHLVMRLVPRRAARGGSATVSWKDGSSMAIFCSRRASARSFSTCLNSSSVVEPMTRSSPSVRIGLMSVARSIVPPVVAPAPTVEWISSMKRIGLRRCGERLDHRLEALLEIAAEPRAGEQRAGVEREDLGVLAAARERRARAGAARGLRPARSCRRRPRRRRPGCSCGGRQSTSIVRCELVRAADERVELAAPRALGQVHG